MKKLLIIALCAHVFVCPQDQEQPHQTDVQEQNVQSSLSKSQPFIIDTIDAVVYGPSGTQVITRSDVERPSLAGQMRSLEDLVFERLMVIDAKKHNLPMDDEAVDKYLQNIMRENGLTHDQLNEIFASAGYTLKEGREQFQIMQTVNMMLDFKVRSGLIVPRKDIENYFDAHPETTPEEFLIQYVQVPFNPNMDKDRQKKELMFYAQTGKSREPIAWSEPFWIMREDIAEQKAFVLDLAVGGVSQPQEVAGGFEMYRMKDKKEARERTFEERYREIADILRQPRYQQLLTDYKKSLFDLASILYL